MVVGLFLVYGKYRHLFQGVQIDTDTKALKKQFSYAALIFLAANVGNLL